MGRRWVGGVAALLLGGALASSGVAPAAGQAALPPSPPRPLSFLHAGAVAGPANLRQVVDEQGREVLLKGVNVDGIADYWQQPPALPTPYPIDPSQYRAGKCPPDDHAVEGVMVCDFDFAQMRVLGYDAIRLNLSWSLLEPLPGQIDTTYIDRIAQVVGWAKAQGIYVILDMHQDAWSKFVYTHPGDNCAALGPGWGAVRGYDGAPRWASQYVGPACAFHGVREIDPAVDQCFKKFYLDAAAPDGVGLQEHYASIFVALARRFKNEDTVAGYEIMNEPNPTPGGSDYTELFPMYAKVINTVVNQVPKFRQLFFFEPNTLRDVTDFSAEATPWSAYSSYPNAVYAPHIYTGTFTADQEIFSTRFFPSDGGYKSAIMDAQLLGVPLWVGEFGNNPSDDNTLLRSQYQLQDGYDVAGTLWLWKENANDINSSFFWGVYGPPFDPPTGGVPRPSRIKFTARAYPIFTAGVLQSFTYNPDDGSFDMRATSTRVATGDRLQAALLYLPAASQGDVMVEGATLEVSDRGGGSREVYVYPQGGAYHVHLVTTASGGTVLPNTSR